MAHKHHTEPWVEKSEALRGPLRTCSASTEPTLRSCRRFSFVLPVGECHRTKRLSCRPHFRCLRTAGACTGCSRSQTLSQAHWAPMQPRTPFQTQQAESATLYLHYRGLHSTRTLRKGREQQRNSTSACSHTHLPQAAGRTQFFAPSLPRRQRVTSNTAQHSQLPNIRMHPQTDKQDKD